MDLEQLGLARKPDSHVLQHRHQTLTERLELLARVPDLTDSEVTARLEDNPARPWLEQPRLRRRIL
jgi:hypothetical protein